MAAGAAPAGRFARLFGPAAAALASAPAALAGASLYPNPATGSTTVTLPALPGATSATLTLCDTLIRTVLSRRTALLPTGNSQALDLRGLASGVYVLPLEAGDAKPKLVVE